MSPEFGRKNRPDPQACAPAVLNSSLKRSSNISLILMGTLVFTGTFAGGTALLAWQKPGQTQNCASAADANTQACATQRRSSVYWRPSIHWWYPDRSSPPAAKPAGSAFSSGSTGNAASTAAFAPAGGEGKAVGRRSLRGGFGASGRTVSRSSAAS